MSEYDDNLGDGPDRDGLPVGDDDMGAAYHRPSSEPFVDPSFPDSEYDADPDFGRSGLDDGEDGIGGAQGGPADHVEELRQFVE